MGQSSGNTRWKLPEAFPSEVTQGDDMHKILPSMGVWAAGVCWELVTPVTSGLVRPEMPGFPKENRCSA